MTPRTLRAAMLALGLLSGGLAGAGLPTLAVAADVQLGALTLTGGFSRATLPNAPVAGGFLTITNAGTEDDRLVSATSPVSGEVQIHEMKMDGDVMKMAELPDGLVIGAGQTVTLAPGGFHLMFMQLNQPLVEGTKVPVTLTFERAGTVEIELDVGAVNARDAGHAMHGDMHSDASHANHASHADHAAHHHGSGMGMDTTGLSDIDAITAMQKAMFDKPDSPLTMGPIVVAGDYAVSDWAQAGSGGRALLRKTDKGWAIHLCSGDALKDAAELEKIGVPADAATKLAADLAAAEAGVDPELLRQFSMFDGIMMVDEQLI